jgi:hypothetical protein
MRSIRNLLAAGALAACLPAAADAATVTFTNLFGTWQNQSPTGTVGGSGTTAPTIRWGDPATTAGQSGYNFVSAATPLSVVVPPSPSPSFTLGTFTHLNFPVFDPVLSSVQLKLTTDIAVDSNPIGNFTFLFDFTHDETTNNASPCPYGGANNQGVNINGCADRVTLAVNSGTAGFTIGSDTYTIAIESFQVGGSPVTQFLTVENRSNSAELNARVRLRSDVIGGDPNAIPTPAALSLFGLGLLGLAVLRRQPRA